MEGRIGITLCTLKIMEDADDCCYLFDVILRFAYLVTIWR